MTALAAGCIAAQTIALLWFLITDRRDQRTRDMDQHVREAIAHTQPLGPEDRPDWGSR